MSIIFMDGAERSSFSQWTIVGGAVVISAASTYNLTGNYCYLWDSSNRDLRKVFSSSYSELYFSYKLNWGSKEEKHFILYDSAGTTIASIYFDITTNIVSLYIGGKTTLLASGTNAFTKSVVYLMEIYYKPLNSGGTFTLKVNGVEEVTYTGDTTAGLENVQGFSFYGYQNKIDDIIVSDSGWMGNVYIQAIVPSAAGNSTQWTPSTGSNYDCVNEVSGTDTDYVYTNEVDKIDTYTLSNLSGVISSITAINIFAKISYEGTPVPTKQQIITRINATNYLIGSSASAPLSSNIINNILELNPDDNEAWEESDINNMEVGIKSIT